MSNTKYFCHETAIIDEGAEVGDGTNIWHYTHVCSGAKIGKNCVLGQNVYIGPGVQIGDNVKIQNCVSVYEGITVEDDVFLGPSCVLTNDKYPKSLGGWTLVETLIKKGASVGANATIVCGVTLGEGCQIGSGAVVTKDVEPHMTVVGNPARPLVSKKTIGVVGCGTVGGAILNALDNSNKFKVLRNDKYKTGPEFNKIEDFRDCDLAFLSVPTPFDENSGSIDLGPIKSSVKLLDLAGFSGTLIIKSTIPPTKIRN